MLAVLLQPVALGVRSSGKPCCTYALAIVSYHLKKIICSGGMMVKASLNRGCGLMEECATRSTYTQEVSLDEVVPYNNSAYSLSSGT